jgi:hypothetical protein
LDAQPEQLDRLVSRIFFSDGVSVFIVVVIMFEEHEA